MNEIQDQAYTEAMEEILLLKRLNAEERQTIGELSRLLTRLCDAMDQVFKWDKSVEYDALRDLDARAKAKDLIKQAREAING